MKPNDFKEIFVSAKLDFIDMISSVESNCYIVKSQLSLNSTNQLNIYNARFVFSFNNDYDELVLSEIEVHLM